MSLEAAAQNLIFGLFVGGIYGVAAVGLALVFGVLKVLNVAHGELLMLGGYFSFWLFGLLGLDPFVSLLLGIPASSPSAWPWTRRSFATSPAWWARPRSRTRCWSALA
jgi:branched-subunit amino acid ABC-type transport system permease component